MGGGTPSKNPGRCRSRLPVLGAGGIRTRGEEEMGSAWWLRARNRVEFGKGGQIWSFVECGGGEILRGYFWNIKKRPNLLMIPATIHN